MRMRSKQFRYLVNWYSCDIIMLRLVYCTFLKERKRCPKPARVFEKIPKACYFVTVDHDTYVYMMYYLSKQELNGVAFVWLWFNDISVLDKETDGSWNKSLLSCYHLKINAGLYHWSLIRVIWHPKVYRIKNITSLTSGALVRMINVCN